MQLIPFFLAFHALESPLFYNHYNYEANVTVIPFAMGTCQGDPLGRALFTVDHFNIIGFHFIVLSTYEHF